jgi:hypothetical protein
MNERTFTSERLEPVTTYLLGVGGMRVMDRIKAFKSEPNEPMNAVLLANEMCAYWYLVNDALGNLAAYLAGKGPTHFGVALNNETMHVAYWLESLGGVSPIREPERFRSRDFDFSNLLEKAA